MNAITVTRYEVIKGRERLISDPLGLLFIFWLLGIVRFSSVGLNVGRDPCLAH